MKKILLLLSAIALLAAACNKSIQSTTEQNQPTVQNNQQANQAQQTPQKVDNKTYSNARHGYTFFYPGNYTVMESETAHNFELGEVSVAHPQGDAGYPTLYIDVTAASLSQMLMGIQPPTKQIQFAGMTALEITYPPVLGRTEKDILFAHNNKTFAIQINGQDEGFNIILDSFKFTK